MGRALRFIYSPINLEFRGSNNNQVKVASGFFGSVHLCRVENLEIRLHPPVQSLHCNSRETCLSLMFNAVFVRNSLTFLCETFGAVFHIKSYSTDCG